MTAGSILNPSAHMPTFVDWVHNVIKIEKDFRKLTDVTAEAFVTATKAFGSKIMDTLAVMVIRAFEAEFVFLAEAVKREKPTSEIELRRMTDSVFSILRKIQEFREGNRHVVEYSNHMATIAESILALGWITVPKTPVQYIRDMKEAGDYFGNRVLIANKGNIVHITWINKWNTTLVELEEYVRKYHRTGLSWNISGTSDYPSVEKYFIPEAPPPPPPSFFTGDAPDPALDRQALLQQLNQGVEITKSLRPVNRNAPKSDSAPAQPAGARFAQKSAVSAPSHPPVFVSEGKKWRVEYQKNVQSMELNPTDKSESLAMFKCENSLLETKAKMNAVSIDNCKRCVVVLQSIISSVELIRCERLEVRCMGSCQNVTLDNCDSVQVFLNDSSANCEVITSKCTSINICRLTDNGDYVEFPVPEQIKSKFVNNKLQTSVVEHCM